MLQLLHPTGFVPPCLPTPSRTVPDGPQWVYEIKHDGFRFISRRDGERVRIFSRHGRDWTDKVPAIVEAMRALPAPATLDGEGVVVGAKRTPAARSLQNGRLAEPPAAMAQRPRGAGAAR
jgi:bifunctional non-homologous end joining protein LigD